MRVLVVGASGTIGRAVVAELRERHEIVGAGRSSGDVRLDITDAASIRAALEAAGAIDAVVSAARDALACAKSVDGAQTGQVYRVP
ncbi:MAG: NAD-dependent epimerase/dehydratase family protein [Rhodospirillales bacterium]